MKVNLTQWGRLALIDGVAAPIVMSKVSAGETRTADGDFTALSTDTRLIRVATDTAVYFKRNKSGASATTTDIFMPANSVEFFPVSGGETPTVTTAA